MSRINVTQASPLQKSGLCIPQRTLACVTLIRAYMGLWRCENPDCQKGRVLPRRSGEPPGQPRRRAVDRLPLLLSTKIGAKGTRAVAVRWIGDRPYCPKCHAQFQRCCLAPSLRTHTCVHMHALSYICIVLDIHVHYTLSLTHTHTLSLLHESVCYIHAHMYTH